MDNPRTPMLAWRGLIAALIAMTVAVPVWAQRASASLLDTLEPGLWELRERGGETQRLCLRDGQRLIQLRHVGQACERIVVGNEPDEVSVQYTCRGHGYGLTHIRRETPRLLQIDSRGVENGLPFEFAAEGRRVGACGG